MTKRLENPPMTGPEVLEEVDHFILFDVHPLMICQQMGRTPGSIYMLARRYGRKDIMDLFDPFSHEKRRIKTGRTAA